MVELEAVVLQNTVKSRMSSASAPESEPSSANTIRERVTFAHEGRTNSRVTAMPTESSEVGTEVGSGDGDRVGTGEGNGVGCGVGADVGEGVGSGVGDGVGTAVG